MELEVILIEQKKVNYNYLEVLNIEVSILNLELLGILRESVINFQMRFVAELENLLLTKLVFIRNSDELYTYIFRINDYYALNNLSKIKPLGDYILNDFSFKKRDNKRKQIRYESLDISKKIKLLYIDGN